MKRYENSRALFIKANFNGIAKRNSRALFTDLSWFDDPVNIFATFHLDSRNLWEYFPILASYWQRTNRYAEIWDLYYEGTIAETYVFKIC